MDNDRLDAIMSDNSVSDVTKVLTLLDKRTVEAFLLSDGHLDAFRRTDRCLQLFIFIAKELKDKGKSGDQYDQAIERLKEWWLRDNNDEVTRVWYVEGTNEAMHGIDRGQAPSVNGYYDRKEKKVEVVEREILDAFYRFGSADSEIRISRRNA